MPTIYPNPNSPQPTDVISNSQSELLANNTFLGTAYTGVINIGAIPAAPPYDALVSCGWYYAPSSAIVKYGLITPTGLSFTQVKIDMNVIGPSYTVQPYSIQTLLWKFSGTAGNYTLAVNQSLTTSRDLVIMTFNVSPSDKVYFMTIGN